MCVKDVKYMYWIKKKLVWVFENRGDRGDGNETSLKKGGGIEMSTTVLPLRDARSHSLELLTFLTILN